jgi:hypothetical protein
LERLQFVGAPEVETVFIFIPILMSAGEMYEVFHWSVSGSGQSTKMDFCESVKKLLDFILIGNIL